MEHLDLFSGIGGFAYALDQVFYEEEIQHTFVENDPFCQSVLRKHWPDSSIYGNIKELTPHDVWSAFAHDVKNQQISQYRKKPESGKAGTVENVRVPITKNGESGMESDIGNELESGWHENVRRYLIDMGVDVNVAAKVKKNFSHLTINEIMELKKESGWVLNGGMSQSNEDSQTTTNSSVITATWQKPSTKYVHTKENKKHWPEAEIHGDIREFVADARGKKQRWVSSGERQKVPSAGECYILTGGFPCQPFSHAGRRKGTDDDRYLWPEMFAAVTLFRPRWVIVENVAGLNTMVQYDSGFEMEEKEYPTEADARIALEEIRRNEQGRRSGKGVLATVVENLTEAGYSVETFIVPAVAVNAPHRRDRVWIVANRKHEGLERQLQHCAGLNRQDEGIQSGTETGSRECKEQDSWNENWPEVAARLCTVDDGLSNGLVRPRGWRNAALKAAGNAIVPQVAMMILQGIKEVNYPPITSEDV